MGNPEQIYAFDLSNGALLWRLEGQGRGTSFAPVYSSDLELLVLNELTYRLIEPMTGKVVFETKRPDFNGNFSYPRNKAQVYDDKYFALDGVIHVETGKTLHERTISSSQITLPFISKNMMLISDFSRVVSINIDDFRIVWVYSKIGQSGDELLVYADPIVLDDIVYALFSDASLRALEFETGSEIGAWYARGIVDKRFDYTPLTPGLAAGDGMLFATFGTTELCAFSNR